MEWLCFVSGLILYGQPAEQFLSSYRPFLSHNTETVA